MGSRGTLPRGGEAQSECRTQLELAWGGSPGLQGGWTSDSQGLDLAWGRGGERGGLRGWSLEGRLDVGRLQAWWWR